MNLLTFCLIRDWHTFLNYKLGNCGNIPDHLQWHFRLKVKVETRLECVIIIELRTALGLGKSSCWSYPRLERVQISSSSFIKYTRLRSAPCQGRGRSPSEWRRVEPERTVCMQARILDPCHSWTGTGVGMDVAVPSLMLKFSGCAFRCQGLQGWAGFNESFEQWRCSRKLHP